MSAAENSVRNWIPARFFDEAIVGATCPQNKFNFALIVLLGGKS
jgi:hypothetical protein